MIENTVTEKQPPLKLAEAVQRCFAEDVLQRPLQAMFSFFFVVASVRKRTTDKVDMQEQIVPSSKYLLLGITDN